MSKTAQSIGCDLQRKNGPTLKLTGGYGVQRDSHPVQRLVGPIAMF